MSLSYRNQSIDLQSNSLDWYRYYRDLRHERVKIWLEAVIRRCFVKRTFLKISQNLQEKTYTGAWFYGLQTSNFIKKESSIQVFSCEFWEIFKNNYFLEHLQTSASLSSIVVI